MAHVRPPPPPLLRGVAGAGAPGAESLKPGDPLLALSRCELVGSNATALRACAAEAAALGFHAVLLTTRLRGEARQRADQLLVQGRGGWDAMGHGGWHQAGSEISIRLRSGSRT